MFWVDVVVRGSAAPGLRGYAEAPRPGRRRIHVLDVATHLQPATGLLTAR